MWREAKSVGPKEKRPTLTVRDRVVEMEHARVVADDEFATILKKPE